MRAACERAEPGSSDQDEGDVNVPGQASKTTTMPAEGFEVNFVIGLTEALIASISGVGKIVSTAN